MTWENFLQGRGQGGEDDRRRAAADRRLDSSVPDRLYEVADLTGEALAGISTNPG